MSTEVKDSIRSTATLRILDLIGEGQIGGLVSGSQSIFLNDTPLQNADGSYNFNGVAVDTRTGTNDQTPITFLGSLTESPFSLNVQVKTTNPYTFAVSNPEADTVRVIVTLPSLQSTNSTNGNTSGTSVSYKFQWSIDGRAFVDCTNTFTTTGRSRSKYQKNHMIALPTRATLNMRMVRITADSTSQYLNNDTFLDSYSEIVSMNLSYPNSALCALTVDSAQFSSQIPSRSYLVDGLIISVPSNYDASAKTYSGFWDGTFKKAVSNNPAWVLYDLLTSKRYGLGQRVDESQVDKANLYTIGKYCDELVPDGFGGMEPRFELNAVLYTRQDAYKIISDVTSVFKGMSYWGGGMVKLTQDSPSIPVGVHAAANVVGGDFLYVGSARKDRHSVVCVTWNDPSDYYRQKVEYVEDRDLIDRYGVVQLDTMAFGCSSRGQAARVGRWILYTERDETNLISYKLGKDAAFCSPGEIYEIQNPTKAGKRMAGRLVAFTSTTATLDAPLDVATIETATFSVMLADGSFVDRKIASCTSDKKTITFATPLDILPVENAMWVVAVPDLVPVLGRIVAVAQDPDSGGYSVSALEHNPSKYEYIENGLILSSRPTSIIDASFVTTPHDINITDNYYIAASGVSQGNTLNKLFVSWRSDCTSFEMRYRCVTIGMESNWESVSVSKTPSLEVTGLVEGEYEIIITAIGPTGKRNQASSVLYTIFKKILIPPNVTGLVANQSTNGTLISWDASVDKNAAGTELRIGEDWDTATVITRKTSTSHLLGWLPAGSNMILAKGYNDLGYASADTASTTALVSSPKPVSVNRAEVQENSVALGWLDSKTSQPIDSYSYYTGARGQAFSECALYGKAGANSRSDVVIFRSAGLKTIWITATDLYGNESTPTCVDIQITLPTNFVLANEYDEVWSSGTISNGYIDNGSLFLPVKAQTWEDHFASRGMSDIQDQIDSGLPIYFETGETSGSYSEFHDIGKVIASGAISVIPVTAVLSGDIASSVLIEWSADNVSWYSSGEGIAQTQATSIRYVRVTYLVTASGKDDLMRIDKLHVAVSTSTVNEFGTLTLSSTDAIGTPYTCTKSFMDIVSALATPSGSANINKINAIISDSVSPQIIYIQAWDSSNNRTGGTVSLNIGGY